MYIVFLVYNNNAENTGMMETRLYCTGMTAEVRTEKIMVEQNVRLGSPKLWLFCANHVTRPLKNTPLTRKHPFIRPLRLRGIAYLADAPVVNSSTIGNGEQRKN